jgi:hypothetical protein
MTDWKKKFDESLALINNADVQQITQRSRMIHLPVWINHLHLQAGLTYSLSKPYWRYMLRAGLVR